MAKDRIDLGPFLEGQLSREQIRRMVRELMRRPARRAGGDLGRGFLLARWAPWLQENWQPLLDGPLGEPGEYDGALVRASETAARAAVTWETERERAREAARAFVDSLDPEKATSFDRRHRKWMKGPAWVEATLEISFAQRYRDPRQMDFLAYLALQEARKLSPRAWGADRVAKCKVHALIEHANAKRIREKFSESQELLDEASDLLAEVSDLSLLARFDEITAALAADDGRLGEACELLEGVSALYLEMGEIHLAGRAQVIRAACLLYSDAPVEALEVIRSGVAKIDRERDPALATSATQTLISVLVKNGHYGEASRLLLSSGLREKCAEQPLNLLKLRWLEGQIASGLGKSERAIAAFEAVRKGYEEFGKYYYVALVGLDLAEVHMRQGELELVRDLAEEMLETFEELGIEREAQRALEYLHRACVLEVATPAVVRYVADFLGRLEHQPHLRFVEM